MEEFIIIKPGPIPPFSSKERDAIYVGKIISFGIKMNIFIQLGSSKYFDDSLEEFNFKTQYFWKAINRKGYFHVCVSKPEYKRVIKNVYKANSKFVELRKKDAIELMHLWKKKIEYLENKRWEKAFECFSLDKEKEALRQLYLLKYTMHWKHKYLKPLEIIKEWKEKKGDINEDFWLYR